MDSNVTYTKWGDVNIAGARVSSIVTKLGVERRAEAAAIAERLGLTATGTGGERVS